MTNEEYETLLRKIKGLDIVNVSVNITDGKQKSFHQYDRLEYLKNESGKLIEFYIASYGDDPWLNDKYSLSVYLSEGENNE